MAKNRKLFGLSISEAVRHDSSLKAELTDAYRSKKQFLESDAKKKVKREKFVNQERRRFLDLITKTGISTAALKGSSLLLGTLSSRYALAQNGFANKNVVFVYVSQGAPGDQWLPNGPNGTKDFSRPYSDEGVSNLMAFRHVNVEVNGHASGRQAMGDPQTNWSAHKPTVDMRIAEVIGATTPYQMMYLGANALMGMNNFGEPKELMMISDAGIPVNGPGNTINQFFNGAASTPSDKGHLDMVAAQERMINALRNKVGQEEYARMDKHLNSLNKLANRLDNQSNSNAFDIAACKKNNINMNNETINQGKGQAELIASALACGLTRVAVLQVGDNKAYYNMPGFYGGEVHGGGSHSGDYNGYAQCGRGHHTVPAYMLKLLRDTTGPDGNSLLDNTVLVISNCMGDGRGHTPHNSPWAMATRLPGFRNGFSTGGGGNCRDFMSAIPVGLGLPNGMYVDLGGNPNAANIL